MSSRQYDRTFDDTPPSRRFVVGFALVCLGALVVLFSLGAVFYSTVLNTSFLKRVVASSDIYDHLLSSSVDLATTLAEDKSVDFRGRERDVAQLLDDVSPNLEAILTPAVIQNDTEKALDGLGQWLDGDPEAAGLSEATQDVTSQLTLALLNYMQERLSKLPMAPSGFSAGDYNPLTAAYRLPTPPTSDELLDHATEFTDSIPVVNEALTKGTDLLENPDDEPWSAVQHAYWWGRFTLCFFASLVVLGATLGLVLARDRSLVLRRMGHLAMPSAILLLAGSAVLALLVATFDPQLLGDGRSAWTSFNGEITQPLFRSFGYSAAAVMLYFGLAYALIATVSYLMARRFRIRQQQRHRGQPFDRQVSPQGWIAERVPSSQATEALLVRPPLDEPPADDSSPTERSPRVRHQAIDH